MRFGSETINPKSRKLLEELLLLLKNEHPGAMIPKKAFEMRSWRGESDCGTTACAIGWATMLLPSFRNIYKFNSVADLGVRGYPHMAPDSALGISKAAFDYLFIAGEYKNPSMKNVAKRLEKFLEDGKWHVPANENANS